MENPYFSTYTARAVVAEKLENFGRERVVLDRVLSFGAIVKWATETYTTVARFVEKARVEFNNWSDSQRACLPGSTVLAEC
jgi:hypothetical protein